MSRSGESDKLPLLRAPRDPGEVAPGGNGPGHCDSCGLVGEQLLGFPYRR